MSTRLRFQSSLYKLQFPRALYRVHHAVMWCARAMFNRPTSTRLELHLSAKHLSNKNLSHVSKTQPKYPLTPPTVSSFPPQNPITVPLRNPIQPSECTPHKSTPGAKPPPIHPSPPHLPLRTPKPSKSPSSQPVSTASSAPVLQAGITPHPPCHTPPASTA